ncbi:ESCO1/2 acetyl-transferase-domain-containing protein, partial [Elsinoe ampelina]
LVQMQINLGSNLQKTCKDCGMTFVRSDPGDVALHNKYHTRNMDGVDLGKAFRKWADTNALWKGSEGRLMVVVDGVCKSFEKRKAREVLDVVQTELGAVDIPDCDLWAVEEHGEEEKDGGPRYRALLYMAGPSCVGLCLSKRIGEAREVMCTITEDGIEDRRHEEALAVADESRTADIGISRIWTSKSHRKEGIGTALLDCVARSLNVDRSVQKEKIAFSQPTTSGTALARKWFGKQYGWLIYVE